MSAAPETTETPEPSEWQKKITGSWYGRPSVFDPEGNHVGYENVSRASVFENGETRYWMRTDLSEVTGPIRNRFELGAQFDFGVIDSDSNRVYMGPDFYGTGQPYGTFVDSHYYSTGWLADLTTWNHILSDGETQVYSSVLTDGWTVAAVFNGVYMVAHDYETNPETKARIDAFCEKEKRIGNTPQVLPTKDRGSWRGELEVWGADQKQEGTISVEIAHEPINLTRYRQTITWDGLLSRRYSFERTRRANVTTYEGPDLFGNAKAYGRALYVSQHFTGPDVWKIKGREFLLDPETQQYAITWQAFEGNILRHVIHGVLDWEPQG
jgi:hypothetical protein